MRSLKKLLKLFTVTLSFVCQFCDSNGSTSGIVPKVDIVEFVNKTVKYPSNWDAKLEQHINQIVDYEFDPNMVNRFFAENAKDLDVSVEALRGDYFEPRIFWKQPINEIFRAMIPLIKKYGIYDIIDVYVNSDYPPMYGSPYPLPREMEFENDVEVMLKNFAKEKGIDPDTFNFKDSLKRGRETGDKRLCWKERMQATPLISFFDPYFCVYEYKNWFA